MVSLHPYTILAALLLIHILRNDTTMKFVKMLLSCLLFFALPFTSGAWGLLGHRIVGEIAYRYLTPQAKKAIQQILGNESLAMATNWADFIKSDPAYKYLGNWHYINLKAGLTENDIRAYLQTDTATDAYTKMNFLIKELKKPKLADEQKRMYLRLLIHIAGDLHQPMHVGHSEDLGGNTVKVDWFGKHTNLHSVWDEKLIAFQELSYTEYVRAINHTTYAQRVKWQKQSIADWITESYAIAGNLYKEIEHSGNQLSYRYNFDHSKTVDDQLVKGGVQLAGILNQLFSH